MTKFALLGAAALLSAMAAAPATAQEVIYKTTNLYVIEIAT
jgi:hypothetical protein